MRRRLAFARGCALALGLAWFAHAEVAEAACTEAGACASNEYCATDDGGVLVTDGGAGVCLPEPCVVSSDCPSGDLCDRSEEPHSCVPEPTAGDGGNGVDASESEDAAANDAGEEMDATLPPSTSDASPDANEASTSGSLDAGADTGSLGGGACDCRLATPQDSSVAAFGSALALALVVVARKRARSQQRPRAKQKPRG